MVDRNRLKLIPKWAVFFIIFYFVLIFFGNIPKFLNPLVGKSYFMIYILITLVFIFIYYLLFFLPQKLKIKNLNTVTEELASKLNLKIEFEDESNTKIKKAYGIFVGKEIIVLPIIFSDYFTPFAGATRPIKYVILGNKSLHIIIKNPNKIEKDFFTFKDWRGKLMLKHKIGGMNIISDKTLIQKIRQWENQILSMKKSVFYFSPKTSELLTKEDDSDKIIEYLKLLLKVSESLN